MSSNETAARGTDDQPEPAKAAKRSRTTGTKKTAKKTTTKKKKTAKRGGAVGSGARLRVRQVRSSIRRHERLRLTLEALGIRHHQDEVVVRDTPAIRGMLQKVHHLVQVRTEES